MRIKGPLSPLAGGELPKPLNSASRWASGIATLDAALSGGFVYGRLHEVYAAEAEDAGAAAGFVLALVTAMTKDQGSILWLRSRRAVRSEGVLQASGWAELGSAPDRYLFSVVGESKDLLRVAVDALRSRALAALVIEAPGRMPEYDLTASRRLTLAAGQAGIPLFLLRNEADPRPSAAETRWRVRAAPSRALPANAPGAPTFAIELLRQRGGRSHLDWQLEWNRDQHLFQDAALSGAPLPLSFRRPVTQRMGEDGRQVA